jgi:16S rRNA (cytosine967-C5)-methyltransferase
MVNAVLRRYQREAPAIEARIDAVAANAHAHPPGCSNACNRTGRTTGAAIAAANNAHAPMYLRVNRLRGTRDDYLDELAQAGIAARPATHGAEAVVLERPVDVARLPGFAAGRVSVQDAAAQLAAGLLDVRPGHRVLDLCAAPGGKTCHILETEPRLAALVAVDQDATRLALVGENLARLGLEAECVCADATSDTASWWNGEPFDRILLDAPCSGTGVIRRHPDIKVLRRSEDIATLAAVQSRLLDVAWSMLAHDGVLLYVTCSIIHNENDVQIHHFLARRDGAGARGFAAPWGRAMRHGRQILPGEDDMDGFYYARIGRREDGHMTGVMT